METQAIIDGLMAERETLRLVIELVRLRLPAPPHHQPNPNADLAFCWAQLRCDVALRSGDTVYPPPAYEYDEGAING